MIGAPRPRLRLDRCIAGRDRGHDLEPSQDQDPDDVDKTTGMRRLVPADGPEAEQAFTFQVAKALRSKLLKRTAAGLAYWELPHVAGKPFIIALETFFSASSLAHSIRPLGDYLYGRRDIPNFDAVGNLQLTSEPITEHHYGDKTIPSGLFAQPEARNLSAVLFTNNKPVSKFNRIGTERGYGPTDVAMIRWGAIRTRTPTRSSHRCSGTSSVTMGQKTRNPSAKD